MLDEVLNENPIVIEQQLAHKTPNPLGEAYDRTRHLAARKIMMQKWGDYLDGLKQGAVVLPFRAAKG
jgi:hypothetical protein